MQFRVGATIELPLALVLDCAPRHRVQRSFCRIPAPDSMLGFGTAIDCDSAWPRAHGHALRAAAAHAAHDAVARAAGAARAALMDKCLCEQGVRGIVVMRMQRRRHGAADARSAARHSGQGFLFSLLRWEGGRGHDGVAIPRPSMIWSTSFRLRLTSALSGLARPLPALFLKAWSVERRAQQQEKVD